MAKIWATLDRFEDDKAVLILPDGQNLVILRSALDPKVKVGDVLAINFSASASQTAHKEKIAKNLLKKISKQNS